MRRLLARARAVLAAAVLLAGAGLATATWIHSGPAAAERAPSTAEAAARAPPATPARAIDPREQKEPCPPVTRGRVLRGKVNLNTATSEELVLLPGVGPALAKRILEWRERRGKFRRVRDLRRVRGFGPKTLAKLGPYLTVDEETSLRVE